jgi:AcrR family transcriptional regulator
VLKQITKFVEIEENTLTERKRTRLSPHNRRMQLLDTTADIIQHQGLSTLTMEGLAKQASVSNPLIYKYFDTRIALLQELLAREYSRFIKEISEQLTKANTFEEAAITVIKINFMEYSQSNVLDVLRSQPDIIADLHYIQEKNSTIVGEILIDKLMETYPLCREDAIEIIVMGSGASKAAAERYRKQGGLVDKNIHVANTLKFIYGGIDRFLEQSDST